MINFIKNIIRVLYVRLKYQKASVAFSARVSLDTTLADGTKIMKGARLGSCKIARHTYVGSDCEIERTNIGAFSSIGSQVLCGIGTHPVTYISTYPGFYSDEASGANWFGAKHDFEEKKSVIIGADVWIGSRAIIMGGLTIGQGAVVGAGAIVTKDVPPYAIVAGVPAKVLRYRFDVLTIEKLLLSRWWESSETSLRNAAKFAPHPLEFLNELSKNLSYENKSN